MSEADNSAVDLVSDIDKRIQLVRTRSLDISFNEILDMHGAGELVPLQSNRDSTHS